MNYLTGECLCRAGFQDIGSKDCYWKEEGKEVTIRPLNCAKSSYFSLETQRCEPCDENCLRCQSSSTFCTDCDYTQHRVLSASDHTCVCRDEFVENESQECVWLAAEEFKPTETAATVMLAAAGTTILPLLVASSPFMFVQFLNTVEYLG